MLPLLSYKKVFAILLDYTHYDNLLDFYADIRLFNSMWNDLAIMLLIYAFSIFTLISLLKLKLFIIFSFFE